MRIIELLILIGILSPNAVFAQEKAGGNTGFPHMEQPLFGQKPPGLIPEVFAPRMISGGNSDAAADFSPDLKEFYFRGYDEGLENDALVAIQYQNHRWSETFVIPRGVNKGEVSPDGKVMYAGNEYRERTPSGWSEVKSLGPLFKDISIMRLSASSEGTYYFDTSPFYDSTAAVGKIRYSRLVDGLHEKPKTLEIDIGTEIFHPFIAPDESYVIFDSRLEGGNLDIYISFLQENGSWGAAISLGDQINTEFSEVYGSVTSDGKYFFFTRFANGKQNVMWVDAQFIEELRP